MPDTNNPQIRVTKTARASLIKLRPVIGKMRGSTPSLTDLASEALIAFARSYGVNGHEKNSRDHGRARGETTFEN